MKYFKLNKTQRTYFLRMSLVLSLAFLSCTTMSHGRATYISEYYNFKSPTPSDKRSYVQMKDSSIVYGNKAIYWEGAVSKKVVRLDNKPYPFDEVIGFQNQGHYYLKVSEDEFANTLIKGKISVYRQQVINANGTGFYVIYFKKENGPVKRISSFDEFKEMISDCKKASDMLNMGLDELGKIVRKQPYYIQTVIETYNNCG